MLNHLCVIDGDYKIYKNKDMPAPLAMPSPNSNKLDDLVEYYRQNLKNIGCDETFALIHSKDGSELYNQLLHSFIGLATNTMSGQEMDKTILNLSEYLSTTSRQANQQQQQQFQRTSHFNLNSAPSHLSLHQLSHQNSSYIAFVISDFDTNDRVFTRLEEAQFKLTNLSNLNTTALSTVSSTSSFNLTLANNNNANSSQQPRRFMIFGWPVIYFCIKNELVCFFLF